MDNPQQLTPMDEMAIGDLVNLEMGEATRFEVLRVHGGWLYTRVTDGQPEATTTTFVPQPLFPGLRVMQN